MNKSTGTFWCLRRNLTCSHENHLPINFWKQVVSRSCECECIPEHLIYLLKWKISWQILTKAAPFDVHRKLNWMDWLWPMRNVLEDFTHLAVHGLMRITIICKMMHGHGWLHLAINSAIAFLLNITTKNNYSLEQNLRRKFHSLFSFLIQISE